MHVIPRAMAAVCLTDLAGGDPVEQPGQQDAVEGEQGPGHDVGMPPDSTATRARLLDAALSEFA